MKESLENARDCPPCRSHRPQPGAVLSFVRHRAPTALGYRLEQKDERDFGWYLETPSGSHTIHVARASEDGAKRLHDRYSPGLHHLAWRVDSRVEVDRMHERLLSVPGDRVDPHIRTERRGIDCNST